MKAGLTITKVVEEYLVRTALVMGRNASIRHHDERDATEMAQGIVSLRIVLREWKPFCR